MNAATTSTASEQRPVEPEHGERHERRAAHEVGADHQLATAPAVGGDPAVQAEDERGEAVGEPHGDDAERPAVLEREPHQRDVVERVAELADRDGGEERPEVAPPQERERGRAAPAR